MYVCVCMFSPIRFQLKAAKTADTKDDDGPSSKKHAVDKKLQDKKKEKLIKEKKRMLRRL